MKMRKILICIPILLAAASFAQSGGENKIVNSYDKAFNFYKDGQLRKALVYYKTILEEDETQKPAPKMIKIIEKQLDEKASALYRRAQVLWRDGEYEIALRKMNYAVDKAPSNKQMKEVRGRLDL